MTAVEAPKRDLRTRDDLLWEIQRLAECYTPEWRIDWENPDAGAVFAALFADMLMGTVTRTNYQMDNHRLAFLNFLGARLLPAESARGMISVEAAPEGAGGFLPKGSAMYAAADTEEGRVYFETEQSMFATSARILRVFQTCASDNRIVCSFACSQGDKDAGGFQPFSLAGQKNLQRHCLYFSGGEVFAAGNASDLLLRFEHALSREGQERLPMLLSGPQAEWLYWDGEHWRQIPDVSLYAGGVRLRFFGSTQQRKLQLWEDRFVCCRFARAPSPPVVLTDVRCGAQKLSLAPDTLLFNTEQLDPDGCYPFGERFVVYTDFYISSWEAFSKRGAQIRIQFDLEFERIAPLVEIPGPEIRYKAMMNESDFLKRTPKDIKIDHVIWEYWNGLGWARLAETGGGQIFTPENLACREMVFRCPDDMNRLVMGPEENFYIRARLVRVQNPYEMMGSYITPRLFGVQISYGYDEGLPRCTGLYSESDLELRAVNLPADGVQPVLESNLCPHRAMYFQLDRPLLDGPIRLFFDMETALARKRPPLRWQYYARLSDGRAAWSDVEVMDETGHLDHSGSITLIGKRNFTARRLFGQQGYFIRAVDQSDQYLTDTAPCPMLNGIHFNTVAATQRDTRPPEFFMARREEPWQVIQLSAGGLERVEVWVNEFGALTAAEEQNLRDEHSEDVRLIRDGTGRETECWVRWHEVDDLFSTHAQQRAYEADRNQGTIRFGNGQHGRIPPERQAESIEVRFSLSAGTVGNISENGMDGFAGAAPFVTNVKNLRPMIGGADQETMGHAVQRMSASLAGMGRLVTLADFEQSLCFAVRGVRQIRCRAHSDRLGNDRPGMLAVAVLPQSFLQGYEKFAVLAKKIRAYISQHAPATLREADIFEVNYVRITVAADLVIRDYDIYHEAYQQASNRLKRFFDPINGNVNGEGWEIGQLPTRELIYNYLKLVDGVTWVRDVNLFAQAVTEKGRREVDLARLPGREFSVAVMGEAQVNLSV